MANRRPQDGRRRMDFHGGDRGKNFGRSGVSPWQGAGPSGGLPNLLPLSGVPTEATLALASNIINLLQPRQNPVPSLLDMPIRRDFGPDMGRYDRGYGPNRMGNQGNFRRTGNYNSRTGERINNNRKPFRPNDGRHQHKNSPKKEADSKAKPVKESEQEKDDKSEVKDEKDETKKETPKTRYDDIDSQLLRCHICHKSMWDGRSFENHLSGRAHAIMMQKTAESYALTADTMRQEYKIREMKRTRKSGQQPPRDFYCAMCDMYAADGAAHRTTVGHRKLKVMDERTRKQGQQPPRDLYCAMCDMYAADGAAHRTTVGHRKLKVMDERTRKQGQQPPRDLYCAMCDMYAADGAAHRTTVGHRKLKVMDERTRKQGQQPPRDLYCAMCDMYAADGAAHRTTVGHRKLKKYLHPTCTCCHKEMPTRIELDEHRLSAEHLRNIHDKNELVTKPKPEVMVISTLTMEQSYLREDRERRKPADDKDKAQDKEGNEDEKADVKKEPLDGEEAAEKPEKTESIDNENTILDYKEGDDLTNVTPDMVPAYSTERGVGASFLTPFHCVQCKLCRKLLDGPDTAAVHLRTWRHHQLFARLLTSAPRPQPPAAAEDEAVESNKRSMKTEESGNWKRRRTSDDQDDADAAEPESDAAPDLDKDKGSPMEATAEPENSADLDMPPDDALEDWDQGVDDILNDENENDHDEKTNGDGEEKPVPVKEKTPPAVALADAPRASPRLTRRRN